jgi:metallo-beta-lactamase family protein
MARLRFLGATGTVTGSKYLVEHRGFRFLVDCGLFQGLKELRERNWAPLPVDPATIDAVVLTHAHLDHTGYLPRLAAAGFAGPVLATPATCDLCGILLPDSGHLQEEDARFYNERGISKHRPALPLYTEEQARDSLSLLRPIPPSGTLRVHEAITLRFHPAGHILGAAFVEVRLRESSQRETVVVFGGDLGRPNQPILPPPAPMPPCDHLLLESTYGNRDHPSDDPRDRLARVIRDTAARGGAVVIPAFAVGRTQELLYMLREMQRDGRLSTDIPIHVDSPMAIHAIRVFLEHEDAHDSEMRELVSAGGDPLGLANVHLNHTVQQSKALNSIHYPAIIISASGMATGGRVLHHLAFRLPDHRNTVLFVGFQAAGTRGRTLQDGARSVRIHGHDVPVRAAVETVDGLSAHADRGELLDWLGQAARRPRSIHLVHGEPAAIEALAGGIRDRFGISPHVPRYLEEVEI